MIERIVTDNEVVERELTEEEIAERQELNAVYRAKAEAEAAKAAEKAALLTRLGITESEAQLLLGGN
jgi:hypothetical protein